MIITISTYSKKEKKRVIKRLDKNIYLHGAIKYLGSSHRSRYGFHFEPIGQSSVFVLRCSVHK